MCNLCNFREKKYIVEQQNVLFAFLPPTDENKIKTIEKVTFKVEFYSLFKLPILHL